MRRQVQHSEAHTAETRNALPTTPTRCEGSKIRRRGRGFEEGFSENKIEGGWRAGGYRSEIMCIVFMASMTWCRWHS